VEKGVHIEMAPLDEDHVRAKITWSEQDVGGGKLVVEVTVKNMKTLPKTDDQLRSDARALAVRFARAFADTIENWGKTPKGPQSVGSKAHLLIF
jgi:intein-encoded DNA endonuclease-like protein